MEKNPDIKNKQKLVDVDIDEIRHVIREITKYLGYEVGKFSIKSLFNEYELKVILKFLVNLPTFK
ncbi:hypothetical protein JYK00_04670 [Thermosipho ferrireducens]|uniref:Uncharacterized protein n=1 Tax=Thermosipho ferrireducens TaxID=2571116 RepID=A0ABX7SBL4_9BACT|nr:hypothetical protein [Thermosipho ferrireducens]QTA38805.1 hypothetical protein JYK00_04670 [Thermosipho ferrireducens]